MDKVIPILPCPDIRKQVAFYELLGFQVKDLYTSPNPYAAIQLGTIELHFYGSRKTIPTENPSMCYIQLDDVDGIYSAFVNNLKKHTGKIPRSGIPRITKVRDLSNDRRFTLTDTGGNTIFMGAPVKKETDNFFRTLQNEEYARKFELLYDVVYSKEDHSMAAKNLSRYGIAKDLLQDLDKAKFLLVILEIQRALGQPMEDKELTALMEVHKDSGKDWEKVQKKYLILLQE